MGRPLTLKQSRFVMEYLACGCAGDAYRAAYDAGEMSDGAIQVEASRLLDNPGRGRKYLERAKALDSVAFLLKPCHPRDLLASVQQAANQS